MCEIKISIIKFKFVIFSIMKNTIRKEIRLRRLFLGIAISITKAIYLTASILGINKKRIVFISWPDMSGNALALFEHLQSIKHPYQSVWLVQDTNQEFPAKFLNTKFIKRHSLIGILTLATTRLVFHTHGLPRYAVRQRSQIIVNLWHGMPLKKIAALQDTTSDIPLSDYGIATSELFQNVVARAFQLPPERVLVTGQPRNDKLVQVSGGTRTVPLWMPTFRHSLAGEGWQDSLFSPQRFVRLLKDVDSELESRGLHISLKLHPMDMLNTMIQPDFKAIELIFGHDQRRSVEELMALSSALITDYSSASIDYLVLKRPIGYFCPDLEQYTRGFIDEVTPAYFSVGTMLPTVHALITFISNPIMPPEDRSSELAAHRDDQSAQRLWQQLRALEGIS